MEEQKEYTAKDYKSDQYVRWCPGCGDHSIVNVLQKAMATLGIPPHKTVVVSGIGCSSRLPYYMNTYGFHTIHGRAAAIATGVKTANPDLTVWQISGDGDCLAIGGNHFIHSVRRNVDINVVLMNNKIYGLTKGQYSPTSDRGFVTKSSPYGTVEDPFIPAELVFGARGTFFARSLDVELSVSQEVLVEAARHEGTSLGGRVVAKLRHLQQQHPQLCGRQGVPGRPHHPSAPWREDDFRQGPQPRSRARRLQAQGGDHRRERCDTRRHSGTRCQVARQLHAPESGHDGRSRTAAGHRRDTQCRGSSRLRPTTRRWPAR